MKSFTRRGSAVTVRISAAHWARLRSFHLADGKRRETLSYLWGRACRARGGMSVLVPEHAPCLILGDDCYERSSGAQVRLRPDVLNGMLVEFGRSEWNCLINVHDHWFSEDAAFSSVDDEDDLRFDRYLRKGFEPSLASCSGWGVPRPIVNLSIVLGQARCAARVVDTRLAHAFLPVRKIVLLSERWASVPMTDGSAPGNGTPGWMDRQRGLLGIAGIEELRDLHVGLIGCGGLGSIQAELLARLGVGEITLVDGDVLESSNLNRWQGGRPEWVGRPKARLLAGQVQAMVPSCKVNAVPHDLIDARSQLALASADVLLAGVDNDESRFLLNHFALQHLQPYFDVGVVIDGAEAAPDFAGRYFAVLPGVTGCAECKAFTLLDREAVVRRFASAAVVQERRAAGYMRNRPDLSTPSAYMLNQRTAALAVQELTNFLMGWRPTATVFMERWQSGALQRADRANYPEGPDPECPVCSFRIGAGWSLPLPRASGPLHDSVLAEIGQLHAPSLATVDIEPEAATFGRQ